MGEPAKLHQGGIVKDPKIVMLGNGDHAHVIPLGDHVINLTGIPDEDAKMLGALVPSDIYWKFKAAANSRKEQMQEAILNAALLYIDIKK
ncbi:hypothetical protein D3C71_448970 [compost metagenome]